MKNPNRIYKSVFTYFLILSLLTAAESLTGQPSKGNTQTAATIAVTNTNDSGPGSLRRAIADAAPGDTINFSVTGTITLTSGQLVIDKSLTIQGPGAGLLSISGNNTSRVFFINYNQLVPVNATLDGTTIRDGIAPPTEGGGGIYNEGVLTISNCTVSGNARNGIENRNSLKVTNSIVSGNTGGIINWAAGLNITSSTVSGNSGYGVYNGCNVYLCSAVTVINSMVANNQGSGIVNEISSSRAILDIRNSTISGNTGSGIDNSNGPVSVRSSTISGNGIGLYHYGIGGGSIENSTISGNRVGIENHGGSFRVNSSTIYGNERGIYDEDLAGCEDGYCWNYEAYETLLNTIVANEFYDVSGIIETASYNLIGNAASSGGIVNGVNGNIVGVNPLLGPLQNNGGPTMTHALLFGSPAIGTGDNALAVDGNGQPLLDDQRGVGFSRIVRRTVDIGAFEWQRRRRLD